MKHFIITLFVFGIAMTVFAQNCSQQLKAKLDQVTEAYNAKWWNAAHNGATAEELMQIDGQFEEAKKRLLQEYDNCVNQERQRQQAQLQAQQQQAQRQAQQQQAQQKQQIQRQQQEERNREIKEHNRQVAEENARRRAEAAAEAARIAEARRQAASQQLHQNMSAMVGAVQENAAMNATHIEEVKNFNVSKQIAEYNKGNVQVNGSMASSDLLNWKKEHNIRKTPELFDIYDNGHKETVDINHIPLGFASPIPQQTKEEQQQIQDEAQKTNSICYMVRANDGTTYYTLDENNAKNIQDAIERKKVSTISMEQGNGPANSLGELKAISENFTDVEWARGGDVHGAKNIKMVANQQIKSTGCTAEITPIYPKVTTPASAAPAYNNGSLATQPKSPVSATGNASQQEGSSNGGTRLNEGSGNNAVKSK